MCPHLLFSFFDFVYVLLVCEGNNSFLFFLFFSFPFGRTVDKGGEQFWMELNSILFFTSQLGHQSSDQGRCVKQQIPI